MRVDCPDVRAGCSCLIVIFLRGVLKATFCTHSLSRGAVDEFGRATILILANIPFFYNVCNIVRFIDMVRILCRQFLSRSDVDILT